MQIDALVDVLDCDAGFDFTEFSEVRDLIAPKLAVKSTMSHSGKLAQCAAAGTGFERIATVPIYRADQVLRRCPALQAHPLTGKASIALNPEDALALGLAQGASAKVSGNGAEAVLPVVATRVVPKGAAWIESTWPETRALPAMGAALTVTRA